MDVCEQRPGREKRSFTWSQMQRRGRAAHAHAHPRSRVRKTGVGDGLVNDGDGGFTVEGHRRYVRIEERRRRCVGEGSAGRRAGWMGEIKRAGEGGARADAHSSFRGMDE